MKLTPAPGGQSRQKRGSMKTTRHYEVEGDITREEDTAARETVAMTIPEAAAHIRMACPHLFVHRGGSHVAVHHKIGEVIGPRVAIIFDN